MYLLLEFHLRAGMCMALCLLLLEYRREREEAKCSSFQLPPREL